MAAKGSFRRHLCHRRDTVHSAFVLEQLKPGGRMVIALGKPYAHQESTLVTRDKQGEFHSSSLLGVAFVALVEEK